MFVATIVTLKVVAPSLSVCFSINFELSDTRGASNRVLSIAAAIAVQINDDLSEKRMSYYSAMERAFHSEITCLSPVTEVITGF